MFLTPPQLHPVPDYTIVTLKWHNTTLNFHYHLSSLLTGMLIVTGSVLTNNEPGYFKDVLNGKIPEDDNESGEGFEEEQELVKDLGSKIYIPKAWITK